MLFHLSFEKPDHKDHTHDNSNEEDRYPKKGWHIGSDEIEFLNNSGPPPSNPKNIT